MSSLRSESVLNLDHIEARKFFLKQESYCNIDFPKYICFEKLLTKVNKILIGKNLKDMQSKNPRDYDDVNYSILNNKDGRYAWRPLQLIHPALYVSLVHKITEEDVWDEIKGRFNFFRKNEKIQCLSIPVQSLSNKVDKAEQILNWWQEIEQHSIEQSLDYEYMLETDLTDCYSSIYTHSIAWALHKKEVAKAKRLDKTLIGNIIDGHIQDMRHGQTNGIPQGSVLMDFIAEIVLGFADSELTDRIKKDGKEIKDYSILRYRDDYRIFVNNPQDGEKIVKFLTEIMIDLGLKLNQSKTRSNDNVIYSSIKLDKLSWIKKKQIDKNIQKHLLIIYDHALEFPNSGSVSAALNYFHSRLVRTKVIHQPLVLISIIIDIAYKNPRTYSISVAILSLLISFINDKKEKKMLILKIQAKFSKIPNTGHMEIWIQRATLPIDQNISYNEPICDLVLGKNSIKLWNNDWIRSPKLKKAMDAIAIIDNNEVKRLKPLILKEEVDLFASNISYDDGY